MKAIEENDSSDMSAHGRAAINLHKWRGSDGEIQSEDVQEEREKSIAVEGICTPRLSMSPSLACAQYPSAH